MSERLCCIIAVNQYNWYFEYRSLILRVYVLWFSLTVPALAQPDEQWTYQTALDLYGAPFWGEMNWYWGGGFVADLGNIREEFVKTLDELFANNWIDQRSRALFIEFNLYYPAPNLFVIAEILFEFPASGGMRCQNY